MSRRKKTEARCEMCRMRRELCICSHIASCRAGLNIRTRVVILMHHRERNLSTNTGRLASLVLPGCEIRLRGMPNAPTDSSGLSDPTRQTLLLYPTEDSQELTPELISQWKKLITLIVPDGNWRQASKVAARESFLQNVPRVRIPEGEPSRYRLRREPKVGGLATFEAIARILGVIEGPRVQQDLEALFLEMVERTMGSRNGILAPRIK